MSDVTMASSPDPLRQLLGREPHRSLVDSLLEDDPAPLFTSDDPPEIRPHGIEGHTFTVDPKESPCRSCPGGIEAQRGWHY